MPISVTLVSEEVTSYGIIGRHLRRVYNVFGVTNTSGEPEVYKVIFSGQFNDSSIRFDVMVQRPKGTFAHLNSNKHQQRIRSVFSALREVTAEYKTANAAARKGE